MFWCFYKSFFELGLGGCFQVGEMSVTLEGGGVILNLEMHIFPHAPKVLSILGSEMPEPRCLLALLLTRRRGRSLLALRVFQRNMEGERREDRTPLGASNSLDGFAKTDLVSKDSNAVPDGPRTPKSKWCKLQDALGIREKKGTNIPILL